MAEVTTPDVIKVLQEIRGTSAPGETMVDGIYWDLTANTAYNGNDGLYGDAVAMHSEMTDVKNSLSNVDNTSDLNKPISTATQTALDLKASLISPALVTPTIDGEAPEVYIASRLNFAGIPTSDPLVNGAIWNNLGILTISAG